MCFRYNDFSSLFVSFERTQPNSLSLNQNSKITAKQNETQNSETSKTRQSVCHHLMVARV